MYAVIFRAKINKVDSRYSEMASKLRELALSDYGCTEFTSVTENDYEIAISYWQDQEQIKSWKQDSVHLVAQQFGRSTWYSSYKVQVVKILREYSSDS